MIILPPVGLLFAVASMLGLFKFQQILGLGIFIIDNPWFQYPLVFLFVSFALVADLVAIWTFYKAKTQIVPLSHNPTTLVAVGIYRYSRNPMYLGMLAWLLALLFWLGSLITVLPILVFFIWLRQQYVLPEEAVLRQRFPVDYALYCQQVRRWL